MLHELTRSGSGLGRRAVIVRVLRLSGILGRPLTVRGLLTVRTLTRLGRIPRRPPALLRSGLLRRHAVRSRPSRILWRTSYLWRSLPLLRRVLLSLAWRQLLTRRRLPLIRRPSRIALLVRVRLTRLSLHSRRHLRLTSNFWLLIHAFIRLPLNERPLELRIDRSALSLAMLLALRLG